ncbi:hypothetical protein O1611_g2843 [Lasiodiplodia mahajangana]|uniref:Uncharacterized protein n=1 Tax=Lasiodiplodia mahajangana TaxID=1108764 RepID=A0ACC2JTP8_9PEZI|nr:hypothetical protein O1611_g2843 [Lasiodiplodia mahajangana]
MRRGWYLAQDLIPVGPSDDDDDDDGPCRLPCGRLVCGSHGLVRCIRCHSDYSFMHGLPDEDEDELRSLDDEIFKMYTKLSSGARRRFRFRYGNPPLPDRPRTHVNRTSYQGIPFAAAPSLGFHTVGLAISAISLDALKQDEKQDKVDDDDDDEFLNPPRVLGKGRVFPTRFTPPSHVIKPTELFPSGSTDTSFARYMRRNGPQTLLFLTDGACLNNGQPNPKAGYAFVYGPGAGDGPTVVADRLENKGPFGERGNQSSNRAELRAVIAALRFRPWDREGFKVIVIATDSEYVSRGSTMWTKTWVKNDWRKSNGSEVKNSDLWGLLLGEAEKYHDKGVSIQFWRIPREWNTVADEAAKKAAEQPVIEKWLDPLGFLC